MSRATAGDPRPSPGGDRADAAERRATAERVMVCVSSNAQAPRVIYAGASVARRLGATWYAVYVETPDESPGNIGAADAEALRGSIALAKSLGGTVVRVKAASSAEGLIAFARREGVTHVVLGQSARTRWEVLLHGSTLGRVLSSIRAVAVQVVPLD